jgi:hypothetical protein
MGWPEAFCTVGCAVAGAVFGIGFIYCMCKYG